MGLVIMSRPISPNQESSRLLENPTGGDGYELEAGTVGDLGFQRGLSARLSDPFFSGQSPSEISPPLPLIALSQLNSRCSFVQYRISITRIDLRLLRLSYCCASKLGDEFWNTMIRISSSLTNYSFVRGEESVIES
ncbi:hypothetical protein F2Q68_00029091 [Brassica cretica]|uniref:Uncharacterized protein n=1 Tax=Brassica cretica TaxID=69181 RepID=A0A8S9GCK8_BRACR|nr:hypothetical protein F2Q68_00029091 [Brassica cretica]